MRPSALAPTTNTQRKLGDSMHWIRFHTSDGLSEQWERGNSAVVLPDRPDSSPFVKGYWREIGPFMATMGAQIPGYRIIPEDHYNIVLKDLDGAARTLEMLYDPRNHNPDLAGAHNIVRTCRAILDGTLYGAAPQPDPSEDSGLSPSPLRRCPMTTCK